jgi:hypothetical protein
MSVQRVSYEVLLANLRQAESCPGSNPAGAVRGLDRGVVAQYLAHKIVTRTQADVLDVHTSNQPTENLEAMSAHVPVEVTFLPVSAQVVETVSFAPIGVVEGPGENIDVVVGGWVTLYCENALYCRMSIQKSKNRDDLRSAYFQRRLKDGIEIRVEGQRIRESCVHRSEHAWSAQLVGWIS